MKLFDFSSMILGLLFSRQYFCCYCSSSGSHVEQTYGTPSQTHCKSGANIYLYSGQEESFKIFSY